MGMSSLWSNRTPDSPRNPCVSNPIPGPTQSPTSTPAQPPQPGPPILLCLCPGSSRLPSSAHPGPGRRALPLLLPHLAPWDTPPKSQVASTPNPLPIFWPSTPGLCGLGTPPPQLWGIELSPPYNSTACPRDTSIKWRLSILPLLPSLPFSGLRGAPSPLPSSVAHFLNAKPQLPDSACWTSRVQVLII